MSYDTNVSDGRAVSIFRVMSKWGGKGGRLKKTA
jgi:hypothetical protein